MALSILAHSELASNALTGLAAGLLREPVPRPPEVRGDVALVAAYTVHSLELAAPEVGDPLIGV